MSQDVPQKKPSSTEAGSY